MLTLANRRDHEWVEDFISNPDASSNQVSYLLLIDGEQFPISSEEGEWGIDDSGVCYCDLVLPKRVPRRLEGAPVQLYAVIDGITVPQLVGIDSESEVGEDRVSTDPFTARSAFALANENTLDEDIDVGGWGPEQIIRKAMSRLPHAGSVRVDRVPDVSLFFTQVEGTRFLEDQHPADMLNAVTEKAPYQYRDTYTGGFVASASVALKRGATPLRTYHANDMRGSGESTEGTGWRPPVRVEPRYSRVVVFRRNPDESFAFHQQAPIVYRGQKYLPKNRTFYVELEDATGDGPDRAQTLAHQLSSKFERGVYKDETILPSFDPLLERGDTFAVMDNAREEDISYERMWMCWVETIKKEVGTLLPVVGYSAALVAESKIDTPTLVLAGVSGGIVRPLWGEFFDYFYFDESLSWVTDNGDYFTIDDTASGGVVTDNGDYFTVND